MKYTVCLITILGLAMLLTPGNAAAQQVSSFEQLQLLVKAGDKITITPSASAKLISGKIINLSPSELKIKTSGKEQTFSQSEVLTIQQKRPDSLKNGAIWGGAIAGGLFIVGIIGACASDDGCDSNDAAFFVVDGIVTAGVGAAIGVGIDALFEGRKTIFSIDKHPAAQFHIAPIISHRRQGVLLSMRF